MSEKRVIEELRKCISCIKDPRIERKKLHSLFDIVVITLCGVICGSEGWQAIEHNARDQEEWFRKLLKLENGIPSHDTIERLFRRLCPVQFQEVLFHVASCLHEHFSDEILSIDGKTLRGSHDATHGTKRAHIVSAYSGSQGITLAQVKTDVKSNEITAIPDLLELIDISGCVVTIDAMGCQKEIAREIKERDGDYVFGLKGNQGNLNSAVDDYFSEVTMEKIEEFSELEGVSTLYTVEKGHGRIEERAYIISEDINWISGISDWKGSNSIGLVISRRTIGDKTSEERRLFFNSIAPDAELFERAVRGHWSIENSSHYVLDVSFNEDASRIRRDNAPENMATVRRLANSLLQNEKSTKRSVKQKILRANRSSKYLETVLKIEPTDFK